MALKAERTIGTLHGVVAVLLSAGWTPKQIKAEVDRAVKEAGRNEA